MEYYLSFVQIVHYRTDKKRSCCKFVLLSVLFYSIYYCTPCKKNNIRKLHTNSSCIYFINVFITIALTIEEKMGLEAMRCFIIFFLFYKNDCTTRNENDINIIPYLYSFHFSYSFLGVNESIRNRIELTTFNTGRYLVSTTQTLINKN